MGRHLVLFASAIIACNGNVILYRVPAAAPDAQTPPDAQSRDGDVAPSCPPTDLLADLAAYWPFDDPVGSTRFTDVIGGHDATCTPCPTAGDPAVRRAGIVFDQTMPDATDALLVESPGELHALGDQFSILVWVEPHRHGAAEHIVSNTPTCSGCEFDGFSLLAHRATGPALLLGSAPDAQLDGPSPLSLDTWHHLAGTYDGAQLRLFVDGAMVASAPTIPGLGSAPSHDTRIGGAGDDPSMGLAGHLDDLMVFRRALEPAEIARVAACR